jgi:hypothetical protein
LDKTFSKINSPVNGYYKCVSKFIPTPTRNSLSTKS